MSTICYDRVVAFLKPDIVGYVFQDYWFLVFVSFEVSIGWLGSAQNHKYSNSGLRFLR